MRKKVTQKKVIKAEESSWFNKAVFYSVVLVAICSTATACTLILRGLDGNDRISSGVDSSPVVAEVVSEPKIEDGTKEPSVSIISAADLIESHLKISHRIDDKEILFKCHNLAGSLYSCKIVQGKKPDPNVEKPEVEIPKEEPEKGHEASEEKPDWDPFK